MFHIGGEQEEGRMYIRDSIEPLSVIIFNPQTLSEMRIDVCIFFPASIIYYSRRNINCIESLCRPEGRQCDYLLQRRAIRRGLRGLRDFFIGKFKFFSF